MNKIKILSAVILLFMVSCKKDVEEVIENKVPVAEIIVISDYETLWNSVVISVNASDSDGEVQTVELFANNQWIGNDDTAPFEFNWDTKDFEDGEVELKVIVRDDQDALNESFRKVKVMNTLIDYSLHEGFLDMNPNFKYFTYITSKSKQILFFDQIESITYEAKVMRPEGFNDENFDVHFAYTNTLSGSLTTYNNCTAGKFSPVNDDFRGAKTGTSKMKFTNIPDHDYYTFSGYMGQPLSSVQNYFTSVYENIDFGYLYIRNGETGLYKMMRNLADGDAETSLSATGFQMTPQKFIINEKLDAFSMNVYGHTGSEADAPSARLFGHANYALLDSYEVAYHTPDNVVEFDHYSNYLYWSYNDKSYFNLFYFDIITTPVKMDLTVDLKNKNLSDINFSLTADTHDLLFCQYFVENNNFNFSWNSYSANEDLQFPIIPAEITADFPGFSNSNLIFKESTIYIRIADYDHLNGYENYLDTFTGRTGKTLKDGGTYNAMAAEIFNL